MSQRDSWHGIRYGCYRHVLGLEARADTHRNSSVCRTCVLSLPPLPLLVLVHLPQCIPSLSRKAGATHPGPMLHISPHRWHIHTHPCHYPRGPAVFFGGDAGGYVAVLLLWFLHQWAVFRTFAQIREFDHVSPHGLVRSHVSTCHECQDARYLFLCIFTTDARHLFFCVVTTFDTFLTRAMCLPVMRVPRCQAHILKHQLLAL
jgi:hypothetical protein